MISHYIFYCIILWINAVPIAQDIYILASVCATFGGAEWVGLASPPILWTLPLCFNCRKSLCCKYLRRGGPVKIVVSPLIVSTYVDSSVWFTTPIQTNTPPELETKLLSRGMYKGALLPFQVTTFGRWETSLCSTMI